MNPSTSIALLIILGMIAFTWYELYEESLVPHTIVDQCNKSAFTREMCREMFKE